MDKQELELLKILPKVNRICSFFLFGKKLDVRGLSNFPEKGPSLIVGNHAGSFKDIAVIVKIIPRTFFFTANKSLFTKKDMNLLVNMHLNRHLKEFGPVVNMALKPVTIPLRNFLANNLPKVGTIPVDLLGSKRKAIAQSQEYLEKGRAVILLQGRGRVHPENPHPYINPFRRGPAVLCYNLYKELGISVPVTTVTMFGTHKPWIEPGKVKVQVGKPLYIRDYLTDNFETTVQSFREAMETQTRRHFYELLRS
jgi:1-acyl-sn-glycerol-3-phosphate acyltransferase